MLSNLIISINTQNGILNSLGLIMNAETKKKKRTYSWVVRVLGRIRHGETFRSSHDLLFIFRNGTLLILKRNKMKLQRVNLGFWFEFSYCLYLRLLSIGTKKREGWVFIYFFNLGSKLMKYGRIVTVGSSGELNI